MGRYSDTLTAIDAARARVAEMKALCSALEERSRRIMDALTIRRTVTEHAAGWAVTGSDFVTTDRTLAAAVASELDRIDPLMRPESSV